LSRQDIFLLLAASVGLILAFPPSPVGIIAIVVLVPFFFYLRGKSFLDAFRGGYVVGFLWAAGTVYWIGWATVIGLIGVLIIMPLFIALFSVIHVWFWKTWGNKSLFLMPFTWSGMEILSSLSPLAFPWNSLAYTQSYTPVMIQYISYTGMYGVTIWVVLINVLVFYLIINNKNKRLLKIIVMVILFLIISVWGYGKWMISKELPSDDKIHIALVQGNIDPYKKWTPTFIDSNFVIYSELTMQAYEGSPDLIIWPETATACYLLHRSKYFRLVKALVDSMQIPLLTGSHDYVRIDSKTVNTYNSALLISPNLLKIQKYSKMRLVPFSERVPFVEELPLLYRMSRKLDLDIGNYSKGDSVIVFDINTDQGKCLRFSVVICYESVFPDLVRKFTERGAQFLVIITNDGWFGRTSGPFQHAQIAVLRAIENRVWIARCANTGISGFIDPLGKVHNKTKLGERSIVTASMLLINDRTFFTKHGYLVFYCILFINGIFLLLTFFKSLAKRK
jgi:apolipoprotein N-acyltransferase